MTGKTEISAVEATNLEQRARKLAMEKAYLQLLIHLMGKLGTVTGLENVVENMLQVIMNNIGGSNLILYYMIDDQFHYEDVFGRKMKLDCIEDLPVKKVFDNREPVVFEHDFHDTGLMMFEFTKASTWVFPLLAGSDLIGVLKMEGMQMDTWEMRKYLPTFFSYAALVLKNEISGYTKLKSAYDRLNLANEELRNEIAERMRAERELKEARDAAEEANRLKSEFLANMSHEIRTPMNGVVGMAELLIDAGLAGEQQEYALAIKSSAEGLMTIINDILDFSKIEARKLDIEHVDFNLRESLSAMLRTLARQAEEKGLEIACEVPSDVPDAVTGDPARLRQVIVNLAGNAVKFTEKGNVKVSVTIEMKGKVGAMFHFTVADTGIGIAPGKQEKIFDPFIQADASTTRRYGGTGLGLAISSQLVKLMGGRIWVESKVGTGSIFHFTVWLGLRKRPTVRQIPDKPEDTAVAGAPETGTADTPPLIRLATRNGLRSLRILLAEDNAVNGQIAVKMLEKRGHTVIPVGNGREAVTILETQGASAFDLVLMDVQMPEMDGIKATAVIRKKEKGTGRHIPIIALTAHAIKGDREICLNAGMDGYVAKPLKMEELLEAMEEAITKPSGSPTAAPAPSYGGDDVFDKKQALASMDGDIELLRDIFGLFREVYPNTMENLRAAIGRGDACGVNLSAHALKGSLGHFGAYRTFDLALRLEAMGKDNELDGAREIFVALEHEMERLKLAVGDYLRENE